MRARFVPILRALALYRGGQAVAGQYSRICFATSWIRDTGCCWVDTDVLCLRKPDFSGDASYSAASPTLMASRSSIMRF